MRRIVALPVAALLLVGGCGGGDAADGQGGDDIAAPQAQAVMPSGIVVLKDDLATTDTVLGVYDLATGTQLATAVTPKSATIDDPGAFDATMSRVAYDLDCKLVLATLRGGEYVDTARWEPPQAFGQKEQCFSDPTFRDDGRVQVVVGEPHTTAGRIMSVDPADASAAPKDEGVDSEPEKAAYRVVGQPDVEGSVYRVGKKMTSVTTSGTKDDDYSGLVSEDYGYECPKVLDTNRLLCQPESHNTIQPYGSVALATVDPVAATITMKQIAPSSKAGRSQALAAPDGRTVAIHDSTGWYATTLDGSAAPVRQPLSDQDDLGDILFWH